MQRYIERILSAQTTHDGEGVKIKRVAPRGNMGLLDPFLMLDEFGSDEATDYIGGFPAHPHRGFETVTYMLEGKMRHTDHLGNVGLLETGGVQWMTAGKGIIHAEMPEQTEGMMRGFQLWVNLPAKDKMQIPRYQEFAATEIPTALLNNGGSIKVIAGDYADIKGPVTNVATHASYFDVHLAAQQTLTLPSLSVQAAMVYCYEGSLIINKQAVDSGQLAQLSSGDEIIISSNTETKFLVISGDTINEPIANYGPFVMNTKEEIEQAIADYRNGTLTD